MASFVAALDFMLPHEGGESNNPNDSGGKTKYGVTQSSLNTFIHQNPTCGFSDDVFALTLTQAAFFYAHAGYWFGDQIDDQRVASKLFDMAVNMGTTRAVKIAQTLLGVDADGIFGHASLRAINSQVPSDDFVHRLCLASADYYRQIALKGNNSVFLRGWLNRAMDQPK